MSNTVRNSRLEKGLKIDVYMFSFFPFFFKKCILRNTCFTLPCHRPNKKNDEQVLTVLYVADTRVTRACTNAHTLTQDDVFALSLIRPLPKFIL